MPEYPCCLQRGPHEHGWGKATPIKATTSEQPTPGPWTVEKQAGNQYKIGASVGYVAIVAPRPDAQHRVGWESAVESANARLIAAAPALLAALEQIAKGMHHVTLSGAASRHLDCPPCIADATIRQARGE